MPKKSQDYKRFAHLGEYYKTKAFSSRLEQWGKKLDVVKYKYLIDNVYTDPSTIKPLYESLGITKYPNFTAFHEDLMSWYPELRQVTNKKTYREFQDSIKDRYVKDITTWRRANPSATPEQIGKYAETLMERYASERFPGYKKVLDEARRRWRLYQIREKLIITGQYKEFRSALYKENYVKQLERIGVGKEYIKALDKVSPNVWYDYTGTPEPDTTIDAKKLLPVLGTFYVDPETVDDISVYVTEVQEKLRAFFKRVGIPFGGEDTDRGPVVIADVHSIVAEPRERIYARARKHYRKNSGLTFENYLDYQNLINETTDRELRTILRAIPTKYRSNVKIPVATRMSKSANPEERAELKYQALRLLDNAGILKARARTTFKGTRYIPFVANSRLLIEYLQWRDKKK